MTLAAYPFDSWSQVPRSAAPLLRRVARLNNRWSTEEASKSLASLLECPAELEALPVVHCARSALPEHLRAPFVAVALQLETLPLGPLALIELEPPVAAEIVDRVLGGETAPLATSPLAMLHDVEQGVLAFAVARLLVENGKLPYRVRSVVTTEEAFSHATRGEDLVVLPFVLTIGRTRSVARVWLPHAVVERMPPPAEPGAPSEFVESVALQMRVDVGRATLSFHEIETLALGDVVLTDEIWVEPTEGGWAGWARLEVASGGPARWRCKLTREGLVYQGVELETRQTVREAQRLERDESKPELLTSTADLPIEMAVEVARFRVTVAELAAMRPGEVLATGTVVGSHVTLRAGDQAIAVGELVNVDGEVGVRLLRLAE